MRLGPERVKEKGEHGRVTGTNWNVLENNKTSERVPGPRLRRQLNVNNCLNPNDKHLLSWISRLQTGCQGCQAVRAQSTARVNERQKKYCEWHKKKRKLCVFLFRLHTHFSPPLDSELASVLSLTGKAFGQQRTLAQQRIRNTMRRRWVPCLPAAFFAFN